MVYSRRELACLLAALAASPGIAAQKTALPGKAYPYDTLPVRKHGENESRPVLAGELHNGSYVEVHETRLAPGAMPHPAHHHVHEEMFLIRSGTLEVTINGQTTPLGPGSVGFAASNDEHGLRNIGATPAEYFVVAFGKDA
jgi:quercetin dioxygenase-like cupin family protein